jgi:protein phosphatase
MGGHAEGGLASKSILEFLSNKPAQIFLDETRCAAALLDANVELFRLMDEVPDSRGMGSTLISLAFTSDTMAFCNVGDSPGFVYQEGLILEVTVRDIPALDIGASKARRSHRVTQALGGAALPRTIVPHFTQLRPNWKQDKILLCSDGLTDTVQEETLLEILGRAVDPEAVVNALYDEALATGSGDDVSIVLIEQR